ncbi:MAG: acetate uptake transporter [Candidatus Bathyarchaeia archaeon]
MDGGEADPGALGLGGLALTTFIFSMAYAGIISTECIGMIICMAIFYGGIAQFSAGMWEFRRGAIFGGTCFTSYGSFWMGLASMLILQAEGILPIVPATGLAVLFIAWGIFTAYATMAALKVSKAATVVLASLTIFFFLLAGGEYNSAITRIAGYEGIFSSLTAWYTSAGTLINTMHGRELVPLGVAEK